MKIKIIITMALTISLYSCQTSNSGNDRFVHNINLDDAIVVDAPLISDFCDDIETIILETTDDALLSGIRKLVHVNDQLYVLDINFRNRELSFVAEFDMDGKFMRRYGNVGRGPGEYIGITDFAIDEQNGLMYLLDRPTGRLISYNLNNGKYEEDIRLSRDGIFCNVVACVGNLIYTDLLYRKFDESNYMLKSFNKANPEIENFYLPIGEHLKGWTDVSLANNNSFIYSGGNDYTFFSNKYSPEIFKLTTNGISNYIRIESEDFIDATGRQVASAAWEGSNSPSSSRQSPDQILSALDSFSGIGDYFETDRFVVLSVRRGTSFPMFIYDKLSGVTQKTGSLNLDLFAKSEYPEARGLCMPLYADNDGVFYYTRPEMVERLRTAAREGMLVDGLDRLDELKQLKNDANPVLFYMKFK
jgi:hypothetical protein